jgi:hypothetical protein
MAVLKKGKASSSLSDIAKEMLVSATSILWTTVDYWSSLFYFLRGGKLRTCPYFIREVRVSLVSMLSLSTIPRIYLQDLFISLY